MRLSSPWAIPGALLVLLIFSLSSISAQSQQSIADLDLEVEGIQSLMEGY